MGSKTIDPEKRKKIIRYLKDHSQTATAKHFKISPSTVNGIANDPQVKKTTSEYSAPKKAIAAHKTYAKADRLVVLNKLMGKIDGALDTFDLTPANLRHISVALGTALDKYRIEEAEDEDNRSSIDDLMEAIKIEAEKYSGS